MMLDDTDRFAQDEVYYKAVMELHDKMPRKFRDLANSQDNRVIRDFYRG